MKYSVVRFSIPAAEEWQLDLFRQQLADYGFDTFEDTELGFDAYIASAQLDPGELEGLLLNAELPAGLRYETAEVEPENWNELWEKNFEPITIGQRCYIRAPFHAPKPEIPLELIIEPKMAFGTGHHQTTYLISETLLDLPVSGLRVLDMGSGSGILGILSAKRGAREVVAIDYDEICTVSAVENARMNGVTL